MAEEKKTGLSTLGNTMANGRKAQTPEEYAQTTITAIQAALAKPDAQKLKLSPGELAKLGTELASTKRVANGIPTPAEDIAYAAKDGGVSDLSIRAGVVAKAPITGRIDPKTGEVELRHDGNKLQLKVGQFKAAAPAAAVQASAPASAASVPASAKPAASAPTPASSPAPSRSASGVTADAVPAAPAASGTDHHRTIEANRARDIANAERNAAARKAEAGMMRYPPGPPPSDKPAAAAPAVSDTDHYPTIEANRARAAAATAEPKAPAAAKPSAKPRTSGLNKEGKFDPQLAAAEVFLTAVGETMSRVQGSSPSTHFQHLIKGVDGIADKGLSKAIGNFQEMNGIKKTGSLNPETIKIMQVAMRAAGYTDVGADGVLDAQAQRAVRSFATLAEHRASHPAAVATAASATPSAADVESARVKGILDSGAAGRKVDLPAQEAAADPVQDSLKRLKAVGSDISDGAADLGKKLGNGASNALADLKKGFGSLAGQAAATADDLKAKLAAELAEQQGGATGNKPAVKKGPAFD